MMIDDDEGVPTEECDTEPIGVRTNPVKLNYYESTHAQNEAINSRLEGIKDLRPFECLVCGSRFNRKAVFKRHGLIHTGERPYTCMYCPRTFNQDSTCKNHETVHRGDHHFECPECDQKYTTRSHLTHHLQRKHATSRDYQCDECPKKFTSQGSLNQHTRKCHGIRRFECTTCQMKFRMGQTFKKHMNTKMHHRRLKKILQEGHNNQQVQQQQQQQQQQHCQKKIFSCKICPQSYETQARLTRHEERRGHRVDEENLKLLTTTRTSRQKIETMIAENLLKKKYDGTKSISGLPPGKPFHSRNSSLATPKVRASALSSWSAGPHECPVCPTIFHTISKLGQHVAKQHPFLLSQ